MRTLRSSPRLVDDVVRDVPLELFFRIVSDQEQDHVEPRLIHDLVGTKICE